MVLVLESKKIIYSKASKIVSVVQTWRKCLIVLKGQQSFNQVFPLYINQYLLGKVKVPSDKGNYIEGLYFKNVYLI